MMLMKSPPIYHHQRQQQTAGVCAHEQFDYREFSCILLCSRATVMQEGETVYKNSAHQKQEQFAASYLFPFKVTEISFKLATDVIKLHSREMLL